MVSDHQPKIPISGYDGIDVGQDVTASIEAGQLGDSGDQEPLKEFW